jgi:two-component system, OmpR family, sensor histidine kinase MtrB
MVRLSLRRRVAVAFGLCSLLVTGALAVVTWHLASGYMLRQRELSATRQAEVNARLVGGESRTDPGGLNELLTGLTTNPDASVVLVRDGEWLSSGRPVDPAALPEPLLTLAQDSGPVRSWPWRWRCTPEVPSSSCFPWSS